MRLLIAPNGAVCMWRHPLEMEGFETWTDATDLDDEEFSSLVEKLNKPSKEHFGIE
ncbi:hypothetical protein [Robbsia andropogonis]|uniref:hypothetical protein n=1 Tax=Robbsia andropogonis TaxID=28092 RepID=UPI002A6AFDD3|nr:hypothetical protein [Robbsia andropogonis]